MFFFNSFLKKYKYRSIRLLAPLLRVLVFPYETTIEINSPNEKRSYQ